MSLLDAVFWGALLVGAIALVMWYGRSWRAVAQALADAEQPAESRPPAPARGRAVVGVPARP